jgi:hypothetical protein
MSTLPASIAAFWFSRYAVLLPTQQYRLISLLLGIDILVAVRDDDVAGAMLNLAADGKNGIKRSLSADLMHEAAKRLREEKYVFYHFI